VRKALRRHRGPRPKTGQRSLSGLKPRSCIRVRSQEDVLKRTKIVLALPSYMRQRLSSIRRGWCPSRPRNNEAIRVFRSDAGVAHRLSLSGRLLYTAIGRVKPKRHCKTAQERLLRLGESARARLLAQRLTAAPCG
jgi:hypothetical protein